MKIKLLLTLLFVAGLGFTSMAQSVSFGPRFGVTFSKVKIGGEDHFNDEVEYLQGLQIGAVVNVMINENFSIQPELLYTQKGFKLEEKGDFFKMSYDYLEVPVLGKVYLGTGPVQAFFTAGPSVGYLTSGNISVKTGDSETNNSIEFEDNDNRVDVSANFGIGLACKVGTGAFNVDARYSLGLSNLKEEGEAKNREFSVSVAYLFGK